jgi:menaquinone-dependent protoporphyrinogen IX oxidase
MYFNTLHALNENKMKGLIAYKGKYGATAQYAAWLGRMVQWPVMQAEDLTTSIVEDYDCIVLGSSVYVGKLQLKQWIKRFLPPLRKKKVFFFIVCGTPAERKDELGKISKNNIPSELINGQNVYFLPGRMFKKKLSLLDGLILRMGASMQKDPAEKQRMLQDFDGVKREHLDTLVRKLRAEIAIPLPAIA